MRFELLQTPITAGVVFAVASLLVPLRSVAAVDVFVTSAAGQPYGVATVEFPVESPVVGRVLPPVGASDEAGRILYPISHDVRVKVGPPSDRPITERGRGRLLNRVGNLIRELASGGEELEQTVARRVSFLFVGSEPLQVRITDSEGEIGTYEIVPGNDPQTHETVLRQWWSGFTDAAQRQIDAADYPAWVENYLVAMLAGRVGLPLPDWYTDIKEDDDELLNTLNLIAGAEGASEAVFRLAAAGHAGAPLDASLPLPAGPTWAPMFAQDNLADVPVEPIATRVPAECFYIRYGSFENYMWFQDLSQEHGGDITRMITLRGYENNAMARIETQLHTKTTQLSRMLGPSVIEDQALVGRDLFLTDGASLGVLFKAKNAFLLRSSIAGDRSKLAREDDTVTLKDIRVAGRAVSFLSSGDNRVRSFMVEDGEYLFVTNSRTLVQRFLEVGESGESLATTPAFQLSRQLMPLDRNDTIFAYFSPAMLRGLVAPEYLIELRRRLFAKSEIAMVHLARLAAAQELPSQSRVTGIDELATVGFLPAGFGDRPDGSGAISVGEDVMDTLRGARGTFLPIADVEIEGVTTEESAWYSHIADQYSQRFSTIDPIMVGIQRQSDEAAPGVERIAVHAEVAPWEPEKYGKLAQQLGPPTQVAMRFAPDDIVALQAHVASPQLGPPTHLFAAIKDSVPPEPEDFDGILNIYWSLRQIPGYLGAWPQPGALDRLPLGLGRGQPVGPGMNRLIGGLYRYTDGNFSVLSFQPDVMQASLPFLAAIDVEDNAQIRGRVGDLNGSRIEGWVNGQLYDRARDSSVAGANFLSMLSRQLGVEPESVLHSARLIHGANLQCTLGGEYEFSMASDRWKSTAWQGESASQAAPPDYVAPLMTWFRGATAKVTQYENRIVADAVIDVARQK